MDNKYEMSKKNICYNILLLIKIKTGIIFMFYLCYYERTNCTTIEKKCLKNCVLYKYASKNNESLKNNKTGKKYSKN